MVAPSGSNLPAAIGRYQILSLIGRGGMGEVFGAFDPHLDRYVALKTIQPGQQDATLVTRLQLEARAIGRLQHRGIVTIHDLGESEGKLFIAMEWLQGNSLAQAIKAGELAFATKLRILMEVLEALSYAHSHGIVHRDIKPSNVWVQPDGQIKLLDFGLARFTQTDGLTLTGDVMGTPLYMSPEQLKGQPVDGRSDVYSCGVTGYELLSRRRPYEAESITAIIIKVLGDTPPPLGTAWSIKLPEIEALISKAMSKSPDDRFASADEMAAALRAFINDHQDDIQRIDEEQALEATLIVNDVQAMRASGQEREATARLTSALAQNPDATVLRTLAGEKVEGYSPVPRPPEFLRPKAPVLGSTPIPPAPIAASAAPVQTPVAPSAVSAAPAQTSVPPVVPAPVVIPAPIVAPPVEAVSRVPRQKQGLGIVLVGVAVVVMIAGAWLFSYFTRGDGGNAPPVAPVQASVAPPTAAPPPVTPPATPAPTPVATPEPSPVTPQPTLAPAPLTDTSGGPGQGRPGGRGIGEARPPAGGPGSRDAGPPAAALAGFFVNDTTVPALRRFLVTQLQQAGLSPAARPGNSRWMITVTGEVEIRSATVGSGSGLTADYSGGVELLDRRLRRTENQSFEGHVLDFGRVVVRTRAERELAEKIANYVTATIKSWQ